MGAFRISSVEQMKKIADIMEVYVTETNQQSQKLNDSIETLKTIADGNGVGESLTKLSESIKETNDKATKLLTDISTFIKQQTSSYSANEAETKSQLSDVESSLNEITL